MKNYKRKMIARLVCLLIAFASNAFAQSNLDKDLIEAAKKGDTAQVKTLLEQGANANAEELYENRLMTGTPLIYAASNAFPETVKLLLAHGANVNAKDDKDFNALMNLILFQSIYGKQTNASLETIKILLDAGADVNAVGNRQSTALTLALQKEVEDCPQGLANPLLEIRGLNVNVPLDTGETPLMQAAHLNCYETVRKLLELGADVDAKFTGFGNQTALLIASHNGRADIAGLLLARGADVNVRYKDKEMDGDNGYTPLLAAADAGSVETVKLLLAHGANIDAQSDWKDSALDLAAFAGRIELVKFLLANGANVNAKGREGATLLMSLASHLGDHHRLINYKDGIQIIRMLIAAGANVNARNNVGWSILDMAKSNDLGRDNEIVKILRRAGARDGRSTLTLTRVKRRTKPGTK